MAVLKLLVGPIESAPVTVDTAKVVESVNNYLAEYELPTNGTNQEKVDLWFGHLLRHTREVSHARMEWLAKEAAGAGVAEEDWA